MAEIDPTRCPTRILATVLGVSRQHLNRLHRQAVLTQSARGRYDLIPTCAAYRAYRQTTRRTDPYNAGAHSAAALELKRAQARKQRIANDRVLGRLIDVDDVQLTVNEAAHMFVGGMQSLPGRVAPIIANITDQSEIEAVILHETEAIKKQVTEKLSVYGDITDCD